MQKNSTQLQVQLIFQYFGTRYQFSASNQEYQDAAKNAVIASMIHTIILIFKAPKTKLDEHPSMCVF